MIKKVIAVLILVSGCAVSDITMDPTPQTNFEYVCEQVENLGYLEPCKDLPAPTVVYSRITQALWARGVYVPGERYVFVDPTSKHPQITEIHEMTHYVLWFNGVQEKCKSEELARFVAGQTEEWRKRYKCEKDGADATTITN